MSEFHINHKRVEADIESLGNIADSINNFKEDIKAIKIDEVGSYV